MTTTSCARNRGRAFGIAIALAVSAALVASPAALGANDPVASGTFKLKLKGSFKKQLKRNGVKMKPKSPKFQSGSLDPVTGAGSLKLSKIVFKKGNKKVVYRNLKATLGANGAKGTIKSSSSGKLFQTKGGSVARNGFGADLSGVKVKFLKSAAKKINRKLGLNSLHQGNAGKASLSEQPKTVKVLSGEAVVTPDARTAAGSGTLASKLLAHCIDPVVGVAVIAPATEPGGATTPLHFPVSGGTVSPVGNDGVIQTDGGVRLQNGKSGAPLGGFQPSNCPAVAPGESTSTSYLNTTNLATNLQGQNIQSNAFLGGTSPGCIPAAPPTACLIPGDKGVAISQSLDLGAATVSANPTDKTVTINGVVIKNNANSTLVLNGLFPLAGTPGGGGAFGGAEPFADGDIFGTADLTVAVR